MLGKNDKLVPWEYLYDGEKGTVVYAVEAHGKMFVGKAKCCSRDAFDIEKGKELSKMRALVAQRKYDLMLTREFIDTIKVSKRNVEIFNEGISSPHYMRAIQAACEEEKAQLAHIKDLKKRIAVYTDVKDDDFETDSLL